MRSDWDVLGVPRGASREQIRKRYLELSKEYHPDRHVDNPLAGLAEEKFREIKDAYERLIANDADPGPTTQSSEYPDAGAAQKIQEIHQYLDRRQWNEALSASGQLGRMLPDHPDPHLYRALAYINLGDPASAASQFEEARRKDWDPDPDAYFAYVQCLMELGRYQTAIPCLNWLITTCGQVPDFLAARAFCYEGVGDNMAAQSDWDRLAQIDPNNELLAARRGAWKVGDQYINKAGATSAASTAACGLCMLLECIFDCL